MPRHISLIFPGQGSQSLGMLNPFSDELNNILDITSNILDINIVDCITNGPEEVLNKTSITQPAILITSYLYYQKFITDTGLVPNLFAGHSLGEYSALLASNSIDLSTAVSLVHKRGVFMERAKPGSMFAILNLDLISIQNICKEVQEATGKIVSAANINSQNQIVVAGDNDSTILVAEKCKEVGAKRCIQLKVSVASHCALMKDAADQLEVELNNISITKPDIPILHNFDASPSIDSLEIKSKLKNQLFKPVQWVDTMNHIKNYDGIVIECGPGRVLTGLAKTNGFRTRAIRRCQRKNIRQRDWQSLY
jgi:[acyl-carrier-protein] S-malonyltransferase